MPETRKRLIETAVHPFTENAEQKLAATELLESIVPQPAEGADEVLRRWESLDRKGRGRGGLLLWASALIISAAAIVAQLPEIRLIVEAAGWTGPLGMPIPRGSEEREQQVAATLSEKERLLVFGDLSKSSRAERREALWRSDPDNPVYFAEYAGTYISEKEDLPPDFLEIARRIAPGNAWFTYQAAAVEARSIIKANTRRGRRVAGKWVYDSPRTWHIVDEARFERSLDLLAEARSQPDFTGYGSDLMHEIMPLIQQASLTERLQSIGLSHTSYISSSIRLRLIGDLISAKAMKLADTGDAAGYAPLARDARDFLKRISDDSCVSLVECMIADTNVRNISESMGHAADKLGLPEEAARWNEIQKRVEERASGRATREFLVDGKPASPARSTGMLLGGSIESMARYPIHLPPITDGELKPSRLFDHEIFSRIFAHGLWLLLLPCVAVLACYRYYVTAISRGLSVRMRHLLRASDHAWITGLGVLLPFFLVMAVNRLTPLGGREFGVRGTALLMPFAHFLGLWLLWLVVPVQIARWRLAKRAGVFGFSRPSWWDWLAVVAAAAFVPMIGWAALTGSIPGFWRKWMEELGVLNEGITVPLTLFWSALGCGGLAGLWLAAQILPATLGRADRQFRQATTSLVLVPGFAWALIVLALAIPFFKAAGDYQYEQDTLTKYDPNGPGWSVFEYKVAVEMRKELRDILGDPP